MGSLYRFGSFEIFKVRDIVTGRVGPSVGRMDILHQLLDHTTRSFFPEVCRQFFVHVCMHGCFFVCNDILVSLVCLSVSLSVV